jgi:regulator of replication initiation timing
VIGGKENSPLLRYGILCIIIILWYSFLWDPAETRLENIEAQTESTTTRIGKIKREIRRMSNMEVDIKKLSMEYARLKRRFVKGDSPQIVATNLQNIVIEKAEKAELEVVTYKTVSRRKWSGYQLGVSTFTLKGNMKKFAFFFKMLQDELYYLIRAFIGFKP